MKRTTTRLAGVLTASLVLWAHATPASSEDAANAATMVAEQTDDVTREDVDQAMETIQDYSVEQRDEALQQGRTMLDNIDARIEDAEENIRENWNEMDESARERARAALSDMRQRREDVAEWYGGLRYSSGDAWEDVRQGFTDAYSNLLDAWQDAEGDFQSQQ